MPNTENIKLWVDALRSGKFQQGHNFLTIIEDDGGHKDCCMGVACKIAIDHGVEMSVETRTGARTRLVYNGSDDFMPRAVANWLGLDDDDNPIVDMDYDNDAYVAPDGHLHAAQANDDREWTFELIADGLERTYLS